MKLKPLAAISCLAISALSVSLMQTSEADAVASTCSQTGKRTDNTDCQVGDTGPGGGTIYYDAGSMQAWGRYLEVAPNTWGGGTADPTVQWCSPTKTSGSSGRAIGDGKTNFDGLTGCELNTTVSAYNGGGQSDWFVPSDGELYQLKLWQQAVTPWRGGFSEISWAFYWSSSRYNNGAVFWYLNSDTRTNTLTWPQIERTFTRPIRYIGLNPAQTVTWSPTTNLYTTQSPYLPSTSTTNGGGAITYSKVSNTTTTCSVNSSTGEITYTGTGNCVVKATAATTSNWSAGSKTITFTVALAPQVVSWTPDTNLAITQSPYSPSTATANGGGAITYSKVSNTTTTCSVNSSTGALTFTGIGDCVVRATATSTSMYLSGSSDVTFNIGLATQRVTWNPTTTLLKNASPVTLASATTNGDGLLSYEVTNAGTTGCTVGSTSGVLAYTATGQCTVKANASSTVQYFAASTSVTLTISDDSIVQSTASTVVATSNLEKTTISKSTNTRTTLAIQSTTSSTVLTTTTTIAAPSAVKVQPGEAAFEIDGEAARISMSRANNALVLESGSLTVKLWATKAGVVVPLDGDGNIRTTSDANISFEASGFSPNSESEVWIFSTPTLLGMTQTDELGRLSGEFSLPNSISDGSHRVVLVGVGADRKPIKVVVGMIIGDGKGNSGATTVILGVVISLAILSAMFLPAFMRRRRRAR